MNQLRSLGRLVACIGAAALTLFGADNSQAQVPGNAYNYTRTSSFTYYTSADGAKNGLLKSETVEPDNAQSCVTTTYSYDAYGNKSGATTSNCTGATGRAVFASRSSSTAYASQVVSVNGTSVTIPAGEVATSATNALNQSETHQYDPRFGAMTQLTGPNSLSTQWVLDDFGRKTKEIRADGTKTYTWYCVIGAGLDASSNTVIDGTACPTPASGETPAGAVAFTHSEPRDANGVKMGPFVRVYTDRLGRAIRQVTESFDGSAQPAARSGALIVKDTVYNTYGAKVIETQPYFLASGSSTAAGSNDMGLVRTDYDVLGRPTAIYNTDPHGSSASVSFGSYGSRQAAVQTMAYNGLVITSTNDKSQTHKEEKNVNGEVARITDASGAQLAQQRDAFGNLIATKDALQNQVTLVYDIRGRKTQMADPDTGTWAYDYDALGELVWQQSPNELAASTATTMAYDVLGRMTSRVDPEYTSSWYYDAYADGSACNKGAGKLCESKTSSGIDRKTVYDSLGRPINARTDISGGPSFASAVGYDSVTGRVSSQTYPTGLQVGFAYTARGFLEKVNLLTSANLVSSSLLWQAQTVNAWGKAEQQLYGNNLTTKAAFEAATGRVTDLTAGAGASTSVLNQHYVWDSLNNLTGRTDANGDGSSGAVSETFSYGDSLNRLTGYNVSGPSIPGYNRSVTLQYNALGMLLYKSDVGNYTYNAQAGAHPHALQSVAGAISTSYQYDANGNLKSATGSKYTSITYTSFNLPDSQGGVQGSAASDTWQYDENHARIKEVHVAGGNTRTLWYLHPDNQGGLSFESEVDTSPATQNNRHFITAGGQVIGVLITTGALPTLTSGQTAPPVIASITLAKVEYWHKDQLGSLITTTDQAGNVTARYAYDPFGKRRYTNGNYDETGAIQVDWSASLAAGTPRGFTGHEGLDDVGLVNMNGRFFDANLGIFLQGDPFIQDPANLQNYNRYGYCYNNPLTCTDPSGYLSIFGHKILPGLTNPIVHGWHSAWNNQYFRLALSIYAAAVLGPGSSIYDQWGLLGDVTNPLAQTAIAGFAGGAIQSGNVKGGIQGAFTAAAFFEAGEFLNGKNWASGGPKWGDDSWQGVAVHGVVGCVTSVAGGGKCGPGALSASLSRAAGWGGLVGRDPTIGTITSAVIGGTVSALSGGSFVNGAETAAFAYLFNELQHYEGTAQERYEMAGYNGFALDSAGECMIKQFEGFSLDVYGDVAGLPTVGWGHLLSWPEWQALGDKITPDYAQYLFVRDTAAAVGAANRLIPLGSTQSEFDAAVSIIFNIGGNRFENSMLLRDWRGGNFDGMNSNWIDFNKAGGRVSNGLIQRRVRELWMFYTGH